MIDASTPLTAMETILARGFSDISSATPAVMTNIADAPSVICDDEPAVTVPLTGSNAGLSLRQRFWRRLGTNRFILGDQRQRSVLVAAFHRKNFVVKSARRSRVCSTLVRTRGESVLCLTGDTVHPGKHFSSHSHHACGTGDVLCHFGIGVHVSAHWQVPHVFDTTDDEHVTVARHATLGRRMKRGHRRTTQTVDGLSARLDWDFSQQTHHPCDVITLLFGLNDTSPQDIFDSIVVQAGVAFQQSRDEFADMLSARRFRKQPFLERPIGVRTKSTITTSFLSRLIVQSRKVSEEIVSLS